MVLLSACAQGRAAGDKSSNSVKLGQDVVQGAVIFEPGTKDGAVVPEVSAPRLRAIWVPERIEGTRLIEAHREWEMLENSQLLGIPRDIKKSVAKSSGGSHEN